MALIFGGNNVTPINKLGFGNAISLASGQTWTVSPAGTYYVRTGLYTVLQVYDPVTTTWRSVGGAGLGEANSFYLESDGVNYRLANLSGCTVGAVITNKGSGYTSAPTVTISGQNSIWKAVVGGQVGTVTVSNGGSNYTYPPTVLISSPPAGGIQATAVATLTTGAVSSVTLINVGGGYTSPPSFTFINDPREGVNGVVQGSGAAAVCALTGAQTISGILCIDPGSGGLTSVPSFTFSGGGGSSLAATVLMCWSIISLPSPGGTNTGWGSSPPALVSALDPYAAISISSGVTNPATQQGIVKVRPATLYYANTTGSLTATGAAIYDGGIYTGVPTAVVPSNGNAFATTTFSFSSAMGGVSDTSFISS